MSEKIIRVLLDDIEDTEVEAAYRREFSVDGKKWEIDLSETNNAAFDALLQKYKDHGRPIVEHRQKKPATPTEPTEPAVKHTAKGYSKEQKVALRQWARGHGWPQLGAYGRVPSDAVAAFEARAGKPQPEFSSL